MDPDTDPTFEEYYLQTLIVEKESERNSLKQENILLWNFKQDKIRIQFCPRPNSIGNNDQDSRRRKVHISIQTQSSAFD